MINVIFLMFIAFVPFPTIVLAQRVGSENADAVAPTILYGGTMVSTAAMFDVIWLYASSRGGALRDDAAAARRRRRPCGYSALRTS